MARRAQPSRFRSPKDQVMDALGNLINKIIDLYIFALIGSAILSWLIAFDVINTRNRFVYAVVDFLHRVTEPALRPIRRYLPNLGGVDISPIVLILVLQYLVRGIVNSILR